MKARLRHGTANGRTPLPGLDRSAPVLLIRTGHYPLHHGTVGAIRSLGRLGVPVYTIVEDRFTPAARSRYLRGGFRWPTTGREQPEDLVQGVMGLGRAIGGRAILAGTDEEAAVLIAEHSARLADRFVMPAVAPGLPRQLATKYSLYSLCRQHGIPTPLSLQPGSPGEALELAERLGFPVVVKNDAPWLRLTRPAVPNTAIVHNRSDMRRLVDSWVAMPTVMMQEYVPREHATDWIAHAYFGREADRHVVFTGRKLRSWPPQAGVSTYAYTAWNSDVADLTRELCARVGFRGICDLDWRFDAPAGEYKLVDFNPRLGAQFRLFEGTEGVDVVRAMHLDLTGRDLRAGRQVDGRLYVVENLDVLAQIAYRRAGELQEPPAPCHHRELAWWAPDDPVPALVAGVSSAVFGGRQLLTGRLGGYAAPPSRTAVGELTIRPAPAREFHPGHQPVPARDRRIDAVVIGAGPFGLATAAHLAGRGLSVRTFGVPMESWRERMPVGMYLKSTSLASSISAPRAGSTLADFCAATGEEPLVGHRPVPIDTFIRYGLWFMDRNVPDVEPTRVLRVGHDRSRFSVTLEDGEELAASSVVVATGLGGVAFVPTELAGLRPLVSHSSDHRDLSRLAGKRVAVIGAGQSALENAAILHEHGAAVEVFVRGPRVRFADPPADLTRQHGTVLKPESPLGPGWSLFTFSHLPGRFHHLPVRARLYLVATVLGPSGAWWLRERVEGCVPVHADHRLERAVREGDQVTLTFATRTGESQTGAVDHVMAATGYRVSVDALDFLDARLRRDVARTAGTWPALGPSFDSSVPGLYFTGLAAAATFGPLMRFVCGTRFAARRVAVAMGRRRAVAG